MTAQRWRVGKGGAKAKWLACSLALTARCTPARLDAITAPSSSLQQGLVAYYAFEEGSGTAVVDRSGNRRDGVITGGQWIADGAFGGALHFDGTGYAAVPNFPYATPSFSVSAWVRTVNMPLDGYEAAVSTEVVFQGGWEVNVTKVAPAAQIHTAFWDPQLAMYPHIDCACISDGVWTHLAFVVDSAAQLMTLYVGSVAQGTTPAPHAILPGAPFLFIGRWSGANRMFVGDIDEIAIYDRALAPDEVAALDRAPVPVAPSLR